MLQVRAAFVRSLTLMVIGLALAGCLNPDKDPIGPYALDPYNFEATVEFANGSEGTITFAGPFEIPDRSGAAFLAYRLTETAYHAGEGPSEDSFKQTWYLDVDFRVVAYQGNCRYGFSGPCDQYDRWDWGEQGKLNPLGIGVPHLLQSDDLVALVGSKELTVELLSLDDEQSLLNLTLRVPDYWSPESYKEVSYSYSSDRLLPDSDERRVTSFEQGTPLEPAHRLPRVQPAVPENEWQGLMFDDEDEDHLGVGFTHLDLVEIAFPGIQQNPEMCIKDYYLVRMEPSGSSVAGVLEFPVGEDRKGWAFVTAWGEGEEHFWRLDIYQDRLTGEMRVERSGHQSAPIVYDCDVIYRSPWPSMTMSEGLQHAKSFTIGDSDNLRMINHVLGVQRAYFLDPEDGWHQWRFGFKPDWVPEDQNVFWTDYEVGFVPSHTKPFQSALIHPDDISNFIRDDA